MTVPEYQIGPGLTLSDLEKLMATGEPYPLTGGGYSDIMAGPITSGMTSDFKKQMDEMKKLMDSDVVSLAAGDKESIDSLQTIDVRGRKMIVSKKPGQIRTTAITFACLYAAESPGIDSILYQAGVKGNFITENGEVALERFINDDVERVEKKDEPPQPKRTILLDDDPSQKLGQWVAVYGPDGKLRHIGIVMKDCILAVDNTALVAPAGEVVPLSSLEDAFALAAKIYTRNNP